ncbi:MAG: hypothetical protein IKH09_09905 [Clostridia bacterium]|nr:hypothetical protein [Clostridia bacterium]
MSIKIEKNAFVKGWARYTIMHKNRRVASVREDGTVTIYAKSFMPYNLWLDQEKDVETRVNNLNNFYYWCASRVLTLDRRYAKEILNSIGAKQATTDRERAMISISYHALCLTDVYWIKGDREKISFEDVSLYRHSLSNSFADVSLLGKQITAQNAELLANRDAAGDVATNGVAPKAWIRKDGAFYLMKDGEERDVEAELLASKIADCFKIDHVRYTEDTFDQKKVSKSKLITSEDKSIVSMEFIDVYCVNHNIDTEEFVFKKDKYAFCMMIIIDYLIGNSDRHWGNWGFYVNNDNNELLGLYPLMDFNKAFTDYSTLEGGICQPVTGHPSQKDAAAEAVKTVGLNQVSEVSRAWFASNEQYNMFSQRLNYLMSI